MEGILGLLLERNNPSSGKLPKHRCSRYHSGHSKNKNQTLHAKSLCKVYDMFGTDRGKTIIANGWRAAGITAAVQDARSSSPEDLNDPFARLTI